MEKRLLIAVLLSLFVLYIWAGFTQPNRSAEAPVFQKEKNTQTIDKKEVIEKKPSPPSPEIAPKTDIAKATPEQEKTAQLENAKIALTFTNIGGTIKRAQIKEYNTTLPVTNFGNLYGYEDALFRLVKQSSQTLVYEHSGSNITITKTFQISDDDYIVQQSLYVEGLGTMSNLDIDKLHGLTIDLSRMDIDDIDKRDRGLYEYVINSYAGIHRKNNAFEFQEKEEKEGEGNVVWTGFRNRYYCAIFKPEYENAGYEINVNNKEKLNILINLDSTNKGGAGKSFSSLIFIGPEKYDTLKAYDLGLEKIKKFYRFGLFDIIAMIIYRLMHWIHKVVPNWGLSILIISALLYFSMYPLTLRGMASMKRMQAMQPEISKLKEKHKDNPQKMNQEMMKLYKENQINPIGGCLPFLLQMPIFIGLYQVLWRSVEFKGANFLWIDDLSQPDRFYIMPIKLPFIGNELNLLPILMMVIMFFQQRISSKNMTVTDPMQKQQQKMMGLFMPVLLGVIFYKFASGLTLYFTMFYIFSTATQFHMYKQKKA